MLKNDENVTINIDKRLQRIKELGSCEIVIDNLEEYRELCERLLKERIRFVVTYDLENCTIKIKPKLRVCGVSVKIMAFLAFMIVLTVLLINVFFPRQVFEEGQVEEYKNVLAETQYKIEQKAIAEQRAEHRNEWLRLFQKDIEKAQSDFSNFVYEHFGSQTIPPQAIDIKIDENYQFTLHKDYQFTLREDYRFTLREEIRDYLEEWLIANYTSLEGDLVRIRNIANNIPTEFIGNE